ncbi:MAG: DUF1631 family protein [Rhodoferax sp.]
MELGAPIPHTLSAAQTLRLLHALRQHCLNFWSAQAPALVHGLRDSLQELADTRLADAKARNVRSALRLLAQQGTPLTRAFVAQLPACLDEALAQAYPPLLARAPADAGAEPALDGLSLSLIDVEEVHRVLLLDRVSQRFNHRYEAGLTPLSQRLGLLRGQENAGLADNPFRPQVFLRALLQAWEQGAFDLEASEDLLDALAPGATPDLTDLYTELNTTLADAGVVAQAVHRIRKSSSSQWAAMGAAGSEPNADGPASAPGVLDGPGAAGTAQHEGGASAWGMLAPAGRALAVQGRSFLQRLGMVGGAPSGGQTPLDRGARADTGLLHFLDAIQVAQPAPPRSLHSQAPVPNVLHQLREQQPIRQAAELDRGTVDVLAEVFDYVFADRAIPLPMKVLIGRLQIPVLKAAMIDRDFFMLPEHPARKLVDTLASASVAWTPDKGEQDPLYQRIEHTVQRVLTEFEDDLAVFSELLAEFTEFLFETEQQAHARNAPVAVHEQDQEALQAALAQADELLHARLQALGGAQQLPAFLTPFLAQQWRDVLARAWLVRGQQPGRLQDALTTMDQLVWSVLPKTQADERRTLVELLPTLVRTLNTELDALAWSGEARAAFTQRLIATHMLAVRMKAPAAASAPDTHTANLEADASDQALQALEQRRTAQRARHQDQHDDVARALTQGQWFELSQGGGARYRCKLQWVSPMRTRFLFTNREGFDAFVRSEREVAAMLRMGELRVLEQSPIVGRALQRLLAANDETPQDSSLAA